MQSQCFPYNTSSSSNNNHAALEASTLFIFTKQNKKKTRRSWNMAHLPGSNRNNAATKTPATIVARQWWLFAHKRMQANIHTHTYIWMYISKIRSSAVMYVISGLLPLFLLPQSLLPFGLLQFHIFSTSQSYFNCYYCC